ncbi:MAG TPA: hypothetical protein VH277_13690 [Gemmatimonadaceae bacterium]|nr:hypothetical protein [Gemmatimonadaceae bacterium]
MRSARACLAIGLPLGLAFLAISCGRDLPTQPASSLNPPPPPSAAVFSRDISRTGSSGDPITVAFTIKPFDDNTIVIGPHLLVIPAGSVCDPATSGYGENVWNRGCAGVRHTIDVVATVTTVNGHPLVEFDTHLRFKPTTMFERGAVMLYLRDNHATVASTIAWCPSANANCVDESKRPADAVQLRTWYDASGYWVYRKIQHFSGYNVTGGDKGADSQYSAAGM